jgi:outer membrane protein assembly factor BamB
MNRSPGVALAAAALVSLGAALAPFPSSILIPDDFAPEGVAVGDGTTFYVGSLWDGDIYTGDLRTGRGRILVDREPAGQGANPPGTPPGLQATGMRVERHRDRLWVAGGLSGRVFAYDTRSGAELADIAVTGPGASILNDLVVTADAVYVTDSIAPLLHVVPLSSTGEPGAPHSLVLTGPAAANLGFPGLNGIDATAKGDELIVGHTLRGGLYTVDPASGVSEEITLPAGAVPPGVSDGVILRGNSVWVVENFINQVVELRLAPDLSSGAVARVHDNASVGGLFRIPTTMGLSGDRLVVVNARFDMGFPPPLGVPAPPGTDYDVVQVPRN